MDKERIIKAHIPDTAFVYGGIRGRTMSSRHQSYAWKALVEAGVKQVIDLRQDYKGDRYKDDSMSHGINYFHYPVHKGRDVIANMVQDYEVFCELIDRGEFFISCAMGLHRTDIALCTYWVFYGADRGKEPPILVGYLKEKGHDAGKIFHVLNTFYDLYIELEGVEPIPIEIFKERKEIIKRISRGGY